MSNIDRPNCLCRPRLPGAGPEANAVVDRVRLTSLKVVLAEPVEVVGLKRAGHCDRFGRQLPALRLQVLQRQGDRVAGRASEQGSTFASDFAGR